MSEPASIMFCAGEMQHVLLLRVPPVSEGGRDTWRFPQANEIDHPGEAESLTETTSMVRLDSSFEPAGFEGRGHMWVCPEFTFSVPPAVLDPAVLPAIRKFEQHTVLDLILSLIEGAHADSTTNVNDGAISMPVDIQVLRSTQIAADRVFRAHGDSDGAPPFVANESEREYTVRLVKPFLKFSKRWEESDLVGSSGTALAKIADQVFSDALREAMHPTLPTPGVLRAIKEIDAANRPVTKYYGDIGVFMGQFAPPVRHIRGGEAGIMTPGRARGN